MKPAVISVVALSLMLATAMAESRTLADNCQQARAELQRCEFGQNPSRQHNADIRSNATLKRFDRDNALDNLTSRTKDCDHRWNAVIRYCPA